MRRLTYESTSVSPDEVGAKLWRAVARLVCRQVNPIDDQPCAACLRFTYPLVKPFARALLVAGKRDTNNYVLVGEAVEYFLDIADAHYGVVDGLNCPTYGGAHAATSDTTFGSESEALLEEVQAQGCGGSGTLVAERGEGE